MGINLKDAHDTAVAPVAVTPDIHPEIVGTDSEQNRLARMQGLASLSPDWYWATDEEDRFLYVEFLHVEVDGHGLRKMSSLEVIGKTRREIADDAEEPSFLECSAAIARREPFRDVRYVVKGLIAGSVRHACISGEPLYEGGIFQGYVGVGRYIVKELQAPDELARLAEENSALVENSLVTIALLDSSGRFLRVNEAALEILGYGPAELLGKEYRELLHPDEQQAVVFVDAGLRTGPSTTKHMENRWVKKDGSIIHMAVSVRWSKRTQLMYATARDVTERYRIQDALQKSKAEQDSMLESIGDAFFAVNREWKITYVNRKAATFVGTNREDCIGRLLLDVAPDLLLSPAFPHYQTAMETRERTFFETYWEPSGVWVEVRIYPNEDGISVFFDDVTAKHETENALRKSEQRFRNLFEQAGDSIFIVDKDMRVVDANARACEALGYTEKELLQLSLKDINTEFDITPSLLTNLRAGMPQLLEVVKMRKDGTTFLGETHVSRFEEDGKEFFQAIVRDLTEREDAQRKIRESDQRIREVIEMTPAGYFVADGRNLILDVNPALCSLSGFLKTELVGEKLSKLFSYPAWEGDALARGSHTETHGTEAMVKHRNGEEIIVLFNGSIKRGSDGYVEGMTGFMSDITARKQAESRLEQLATHDTLTGLPNRALLNERVEQMLKHGPRDSVIAVMFIDLDRFKEVNDSFGHELGDTLLCEVARRLQRGLRPDDFVARLGGDEFVVAAFCDNGIVSAASIAQKLLSVLATPVIVGGNDVIVGASIGISMFPKDAQTKEVLFQSADTAMYRAKAGGRNGYCFFDAEMTVASKSRMSLQLSLRPALALKQFELHYQPRINLKTMSMVGMEALIRWNHPELGQVSPVQFISIAEDTGLIEPIGQWVLEEACKQTRRLMEQFSRPLIVSVNVSARQLRSRSFVDQVQAMIKKTDFPAQYLELELTESALIEDIDCTAGMLRELKSLGVKLAIDDFGTGYSALAYLRKFPIDVLKLDRSFVLQEDEGISSHQFIKAFVDMAHALNLSVVAEGIETIEKLNFLCAADCDEVQGYYFARPLTLAALEAYLGEQGATR